MSSTKNLTASDIALALTRFALDKKQIDGHIAVGLSLKTAEEKRRIATELIILRLVATDTAIAAAFGHATGERNAVRESYHECLKGISGKVAAQFDMPRGGSFYDAVRIRLHTYREAYAPSEHSLCWRVGSVFAELCDRVGDVDTIWFGGSNFSLTLRDTFKRLGALRATHRDESFEYG